MEGSCLADGTAEHMQEGPCPEDVFAEDAGPYSAGQLVWIHLLSSKVTGMFVMMEQHFLLKT